MGWAVSSFPVTGTNRPLDIQHREIPGDRSSVSIGWPIGVAVSADLVCRMQERVGEGPSGGPLKGVEGYHDIVESGKKVGPRLDSLACL